MADSILKFGDSRLDHDGGSVQINSSGKVEISGADAQSVVVNENSNDTDFRIEGGTSDQLLVVDAGLDALQVGATVAGEWLDMRSTATVFNEGGADIDFRIEGDTATSLFSIDAGNNALSLTPSTTKASGASITWDAFVLGASTLTLTGTTQVTTAKGLNLVGIAGPTITDASAVTVDQASSIYVAAAPAAGGSVTLTNPYALWVDAGNVRLDGGLVVNEDSNDVDFRIESNGNANAVVLDAGLFDGVGQISFGSAAQGTATAMVVVDNPAVTATANQSFYKLLIDNSAAVTVPTGTAAVVASLALEEPNITATGTVTASATLYIKDAATEGGNDYALWVDSGNVQVDDKIYYSDELVHTAAKSQTKSGAYTLAEIDSGVVTYVDTTAVITLPATVVGMTFILVNSGADGAVQITLDPNSADKIMGAGYTSADNKDVVNTLATAKTGDLIEVVGDGVNGWFITRMHGTWAKEA